MIVNNFINTNLKGVSVETNWIRHWVTLIEQHLSILSHQRRYLQARNGAEKSC